MEIKKVVEKLEDNSEFKDWHKENKKSYLAHLYKMVDDANRGVWQIGYYNENNTITTFVIEGEDIKIIPEQEIFQKVKKKVRKLDLKSVKVDIAKAMDIAEKFQKKNSPMNEALKIMVVLQNVADNTIYNISYMTKSFNTLNMKIDSSSGKVLSHELIPMMQFTGKAS